MIVELEFPDLKWDEFTDKHYSIHSKVFGSTNGVLYRAFFEIAYRGREEDEQRFNAYAFVYTNDRKIKEKCLVSNVSLPIAKAFVEEAYKELIQETPLRHVPLTVTHGGKKRE